MILVTGGTGLVGSHLLATLVKTNDNVRAIHRAKSNIDAVKHVFSYYFDAVDDYFSKIEWVEADITDVSSLKAAFDGISYVYHAAAVVSFNPDDYFAMRKINIEGTANIVNFCIAQSVRKLCYVSSVAAVGKALNDEMIDEKCEWNSENSNYGYAITKFGAEMEVWRGTQEGLDAVVVNPGVILGGGFWNVGSGQIFKKVYGGLSFYTEGITGYVDVRDVVDVMIQLMHSAVINERYILVSENWSFKELFSTIADEFKMKKPSIKITKFISSISWPIFKVLSFFTGKPPILTKTSAKSIHKDNLYSNKKITETCGVEFRSLEDSIKYNTKLYQSDLQHN